MTTKVGPKGQVVIEKRIRDRLGIEPGWRTLQHVVNDHVEIYFSPPVTLHNRSLLGILAPYTNVSVPAEEWRAARERAWEEAARERVERWKASEQQEP